MTGIPVAALEIVGIDYLNEVARAHWRKLTVKDVVNDASERDLLNGEITIDAGAMGTTRMLRATLLGDYLNNSGSNRDLTLKVKLGATTLWGSAVGAASILSDSDRYPWVMELLIANLAASNAQWLGGVLSFGTPDAGSVAGEGLAQMGNAFSGGGYRTHAAIDGSGTVDTTIAQTLAVTAQHDVANASVSMRLKSAIVEVV